jgi:hypothetical protein
MFMRSSELMRSSAFGCAALRARSRTFLSCCSGWRLRSATDAQLRLRLRSWACTQPYVSVLLLRLAPAQLY